jgi:hypothetical protein
MSTDDTANLDDAPIHTVHIETDETGETGAPLVEEDNIFGNLDPDEHLAIYVLTENDITREITPIAPNAIAGDSDASEEGEEKPDYFNKFQSLSDQWLDFSLGFFETVPTLGNLADYLQAAKAKEEPVAYLERVSVRKILGKHDDGVSDECNYVIHRKNSFHLSKKLDVVKRFQRQVRTYSNSFILSLVAQYEAMFADVLKETLSLHPHIYISSDAKVSAADVIASEDLDAIKVKIVSDKVSELLREKHSIQLEDLFKKMKIGMPPYKLMQDFSEICE